MIGIIGAMSVEVEALKVYLKNVIEKKKFNHTFYEGTINNQEVVICLSGVGKVAASMATTILLTNYPIEYVINIGTAGGMNEAQNTLDIVISNHIIQHDFDTSAIDGPSGLGLVFQSNQDLALKVKKAFEKSNLSSKLYIGDIVSGDSFISEEKEIERINKLFPTAIACEMEAGAIAQVCSKLEVDFVVIRSLSDIVYHDNSEIEFSENVKKTSKRSAEMVVELLNGE